MKAEYNHWYKCQEGQMPEDFENIKKRETLFGFFITDQLVVLRQVDKRPCMEVNRRTTTNLGDWMWENDFKYKDIYAWMLPKPYKE